MRKKLKSRAHAASQSSPPRSKGRKSGVAPRRAKRRAGKARRPRVPRVFEGPRAAKALVPVEHIERRIFSLRGHKVMLDSDLAEVFGVGTKALNQAVRRNPERFPSDFLLRLTSEEADSLRSQIVTSKARRGGRRYLPYVFTEHGAVMLASVLNSAAAVAACIQVVRAFVRLKTILATHKDLAGKLDALEQKCDRRFRAVFDTIREMLAPLTEPRKRPIGFLPARRKRNA